MIASRNSACALCFFFKLFPFWVLCNNGNGERANDGLERLKERCIFRCSGDGDELGRDELWSRDRFCETVDRLRVQVLDNELSGDFGQYLHLNI